MTSNFMELFAVPKPVITVLHGAGNTDHEVLENAKREIDIFLKHGINALLVENYFCTPQQAEKVLAYAVTFKKQVPVGVNLLGDDKANFQLAGQYDCDFMQLDSVSGHLAQADDIAFAHFLEEQRGRVRAKLIGGVRFKYQPYNSGRPLEEDMALALRRCDAIAVTGDYTGEETDMEKIRTFRQLIGGAAPLVIAAGVTSENAAEQLALGDACIVGSYFKENHDVKETVNEQYVMGFMRRVQSIRETLAQAPNWKE